MANPRWLRIRIGIESVLGILFLISIPMGNKEEGSAFLWSYWLAVLCTVIATAISAFRKKSTGRSVISVAFTSSVICSTLLRTLIVGDNVARSLGFGIGFSLITMMLADAFYMGKCLFMAGYNEQLSGQEDLPSFTVSQQESNEKGINRSIGLKQINFRRGFIRLWLLFNIGWVVCVIYNYESAIGDTIDFLFHRDDLIVQKRAQLDIRIELLKEKIDKHKIRLDGYKEVARVAKKEGRDYLLSKTNIDIDETIADINLDEDNLKGLLHLVPVLDPPDFEWLYVLVSVSLGLLTFGLALPIIINLVWRVVIWVKAGFIG